MHGQHLKQFVSRLAIEKYSRGFTFLELLIVISIIGILSVFAISSYIGVQREASVDFAADTVVSVLREAQDLSRSGRRVNVSGGNGREDGKNSKYGVALCQIVRLKSDENGGNGGGGLFVGDSKYVTVGGEGVDVCEKKDVLRESEVFSENLRIVNIKICDNNENCSSQEGGQIDFYFKPPFGKTLIKEGNAFKVVTGKVYKFTIGDPKFPEWHKTVQFDITTGEAKKILKNSAGNT